MELTAVRDPSPEAFLAQVGAILYADEATNSLMLGLCDNLLRAKEPPKLPPVFIRILNGGHILTAAVQTPPMNLVITHAKNEELEFLAHYLRSARATFPGVVGPAKEAAAFAIIWSVLAGKQAKLGLGQRIYQIDKVALPETAGHLRAATIGEAEIVAQWFVAFADESLPLQERKSIEERRLQAVRSIESRLAYFWVVDGQPVSMAQVTRHTKNGISINAVYTPLNLRKRGFASAAVAHLSQKMLDAGKRFCVLYTDLSNPTSNKIYQDVGYREVSDSKYFLFEEGGSRV